MKRYLLILFALFCFAPASHAHEPELPRTIVLDRRAEQLVWSPDSRYLAFLAVNDKYDTNVQVVDVSSGQIIADFDYEPDVIVWSPDSSRLAINAGKITGEQEFSIFARDVPVTILNIVTGSETTIGSDININGLAWNPDGTHLAVTTSRYMAFDAYSSTVEIWEAATGSVITELIQGGDWYINRFWYGPNWIQMERAWQCPMPMGQ